MSKEKQRLTERIVYHSNFLCKLAKIRSPKERCLIVQKATNNELGALVDVCAGYAYGCIKAKPRQIEKLMKFRNHIERMCDVQNTREDVEDIIYSGEGVKENMHAQRRRDQFKVVQSGSGFLPALLVPIIEILISTAASGYVPKSRIFE